MNQLINIAAKTMSVILYPLFIPTYGIILFCYAYAHAVTVPALWAIIAIIGTFVFTCVLPITAIWLMMRSGQVKDLYIDDPRERTMPYIYSACGFAFWTYLMVSVLHAPLSIGCVAIGATIAIGLVALINLWWKVSAHLAGIGGLLGGLLCYYLGIGVFPSWALIAPWLVLSLLLMYARVHLNAHTPAQVCVGWLLGLACTFLPYVIYCYVA